MTTHTPSPSPNIPLLRKAVEFVEASAAVYGTNAVIDHADDIGIGTVWFQGDWASVVNRNALAARVEDTNLETCGTAYCVAGYICSLQPGYEAKTVIHEYTGVPVLREEINGEKFSHSEVAGEALGLNIFQTNRLFDAVNGPKKIRQLAEAYAGEAL